MQPLKVVCAVALILIVGGCETAYYGINEQFGRLKNDIVVDRVEDAVAAQESAKEEFKSAFEQFEAVIGIPNGELKSVYQKLNGALEDAQDKADEVTSRIDSVEDVSDDLFDEWQDEIDQISSTDLKRKSKSKLTASKRKYAQFIKSMRKAESRMEPVLTAFRDHVLYLKHNLNAQAIASLKGELSGIETNVGQLIKEMEGSVAEAQEFLQTLGS